MNFWRNNHGTRVRDARHKFLGQWRPVRERIPFRQQVLEINSGEIQKPGVVQGRAKEPFAEILAVIIISSSDDDGQHQSPCAKMTREPGALMPTFKGSIFGSAA